MAVTDNLQRSERSCSRCGAPIFPDQPECGACLLEAALDGGGPGPTAGAAPRAFGHYELNEELGRGGQAVVYRAYDKNLKRAVALKIIPLGHWSTEATLKRFRVEAEAAGGLDHPHIVPIYEIGEQDGYCFFSMKLVEGGRLDEVVRCQSLPLRRAAEIVADLARTVHYAHQRGILHRDIKPGNILLDASGSPHLTDFGLAKLVEKESTVTHTIEVLGTPSFMAPEQARGQVKQLSTSADIYALGGVLYQLLTGSPPFAGGTTYETIRLVLETEPRRPSLLNVKVDRDLETICLKCLEKDPAKRYGSAEALAEDLERFLRREPIQARQVSGAEKIWRWCRRKPALASACGLALVALLIIAIGAPIVALRIRAAENKAREELWISYLAQARAQRLSGAQGRRADSLQAIAAAARMRPSLELRNEAIAALALTDTGAPVPVRAGSGRLDRVVLDAAFTRYALLGKNGGVKIHSLKDHHRLVELTAPPYVTANGSFSGDGNWFSLVLSDGRTLLWNLSRPETAPRTNFPAVLDAQQSVAFRPDSRVFAMAGRDGAVHFYDLESGAELPPLPVDGAAYRIAFDRAGEKLAVMIGGSVHIWDVRERRRLKSISHSTAGTVMDWHPDGCHLAVGFDYGELWWWDTVSGNERPLRGHSSYVSGVGFDPTGAFLVSASLDGTRRFLDGTLGHPLFEGRGAGWCQFSSDAGRIAFLRSHGEAEIAPILRSEVYRQSTSTRVTHPHLNGVDVSPDGRWFAYTDRQHCFLGEMSSGREMAALTMPEISWPKFHPNGRLLFAVTPNAIVQWPIEAEANSDLRAGLPSALFSRPGSEFQRSTISADGELMAVAGHNYNVVIDLRIPGRSIEFARGWRESFVALSPDKQRAAVAMHNGSGVTVWRTSDGKLIRQVLTNENAQIAFSPGSRELVTATGGECLWWNTETWQLRRRFPLNLSGEAGLPLTFSPDGKLFALAVDRQHITLFDPASGGELATLTPPELLNVEPLVFSGDGSHLLAGTQNGVVAMWNLRALRRELKVLGLDWATP